MNSFVMSSSSSLAELTHCICRQADQAGQFWQMISALIMTLSLQRKIICWLEYVMSITKIVLFCFLSWLNLQNTLYPEELVINVD